uniref:Reverse transcriptase domain-containing protein n=1 Tax=Anolis carolinensis TaxID=28377 RepID=A0A803SZ68_ANOCA
MYTGNTQRHHNEKSKILGMQLAVERPHRQYGSAIFVRSGAAISATSLTEVNNIEILSVELDSCTISSLYKPPGVDFYFTPPTSCHNHEAHFVVGDFNSHSCVWGYDKDDRNGEAVLTWADNSRMNLLHDSKLPPSFNSGRWKRGYNPDLIFVKESISHQCTKRVLNPIPNTQHRPICCVAYAAVRPKSAPFRRRYNFNKANWTKFTETLEAAISDIEPSIENYDLFVEAVKRSSRLSIPRGCRTSYLPGLNEESLNQLQEYLRLFQENPYSDGTIAAGQKLSTALANAKKDHWIELLENLDMSKSSRKAWQLLRHLDSDPLVNPGHANVTPNQIAHQLIQNGKTNCSRIKMKINRVPELETHQLSSPLNLKELREAIKRCKTGKAPGLDELMMEQIKHLGPKAENWLLKFYNQCLAHKQIPRAWRKTKIIAILKPGKDASNARNYRPISLLCHLYKVYERMLLNRLGPVIEPKLIAQQAGFRPGKNCTGQILHLTEHIEEGYEKGCITGTVFVDLTAAYDTVQHRKMLHKVYHITRDFDFTKTVQTLLENRSFYVEFQGQKSRWRRQKNGLPQGSVLAPTLFNIFTNDQPQPPLTKSFIYADDLGLTTQAKDFETVEKQLTNALKDLSSYYKENHLKPNPSKTQVCAFHLRNREANRKLKVTWEGQELEHCFHPKYLGVTLDRTLTYRKHCMNTKHKVAARNNILRKLTGSAWGADPQVIRTSALALSFSTAEYACPVWHKSAHAKQVDIALNETCRIITGCLKPTPVDKLYKLAGIAPPDVRQEVAANGERKKVKHCESHPLHGYHPPPTRLKSRKGFMRTTTPLDGPPTTARVSLWAAKPGNSNWMAPQEGLPPGANQEWATWKSLNRLRSGVGRSKDNLARWHYLEESSTLCDCGAEQTTQHMYACPQCPALCTEEELFKATDNAVAVARFWSKTI